jgi:hypothetical protein
MKSWPDPGAMSLIHGAKYRPVTMTLKNFSRPKAIGATVNAIRSTTNAW